MKLVEVVATLDDTDDDLTIFADRSSILSPDSPAAVATADAGAPEGLTYLLEVYLAKEAVEVWSQWREGRQPSLAKSARRSSGMPSTMPTCRSKQILRARVAVSSSVPTRIRRLIDECWS